MKLFIALSLYVVSITAFAAGDAAAGKAKSVTCAACHGANGVSAIPTYPNLAGQKEAYLAAALASFKSGERTGGQSAIMTPMAAGLSDQDIKDLAAYYSQMDAAK